MSEPRSGADRPGLEYLLEVRAEEIPARMLPPAMAELAERFGARLAERGLEPGEVETAFTPRRLLLLARGLPEREPDREEQLVGPPVAVAFKDGQPTPAALGFARRCGVEPEALERIATDKGEYLAATQRTAGRPTAEVLAELVPEIVARLSWAKTMRWGTGQGPWVRPVHGVVSLLGGETVPFRLFGVEAGRRTAGHPVLSPDSFEVADAADHRRKLAARRIIVRAEDRRQRLLDGFRAAAGELGGELVEDDELLDKLAAICEIPGVLVGSLDAEFLELPREVLIASLRDHQSALTVEEPGNGDGAAGARRLLPFFLTVMDRPDDPAGRVRAGNEWVVAARLADARFFYREDRRTPLAERLPRLAGLTFHERLGSYRDKAERIVALAETLCGALGWHDEQADAATAGRLAKADLTTEMVKEFTSLQGQVGGLYAREEGYGEAVWQAVYDHYLPASTDDPIPRGRVGRAVALADRLDTLVGIFGIGLVPTGSRDPFGLRRAAQGVVRIALEGELSFDLDLLAAKAARLYRESGAQGFANPEEVVDALRPFLDDRVRHLLGRRGYAYDEIAAALAVGGGGDLPDLARRVAALHAARSEADFLSVVLAAKRIANIIRDHEEYPLDPEALVEEAERDLHRAYQELRGTIDEAAAAGEYERGLAHIARFAGALDRFFVEVLVMAEDRRLRRNRIALLQAIHRVVSRVARLPEMVVEKAEYRR